MKFPEIRHHCNDHSHKDEYGHQNHHHGGRDFADYTESVAEYKKSFPTKRDVLENTPDPAVKELLLRMEKVGCETPFDRFDQQKPHCSFGMAGICCRNCNIGPCRITKKSPRGACGADADLIVARNLLRWVAAGAAAHGARGREIMLTLKAAAEGSLNLQILGEEKLRKSAAQLGIDIEGKTIKSIASKVADVLLEDLSRTVPDKHKTLHAFATSKRIKVWKDLDILPVSAYHEVVEALHRTTTGTDGDWKNVMQQFLRCGLAFAWTSTLGSSIAMDSLFGHAE
jgi:anaerobic carbon-monoxide dehydrogenase catalytic subunit